MGVTIGTEEDSKALNLSKLRYHKVVIMIDADVDGNEQTDGKSDGESVVQRAEARFMRALNYCYLIDMFGKVPFVTKVSTENPSQVERAELFRFIEKELLEASEAMKDPQTNAYGRADKAAAWLLLARLYLNAEVYTGTAQWAKAAEYARKVMNTSYSLSPVYKHLFMADNNGNAH